MRDVGGDRRAGLRVLIAFEIIAATDVAGLLLLICVHLNYFSEIKIDFFKF